MQVRDDQNQDGSMTVGEAGKKGGESTRDQYGPEFYSEIGAKGARSKNRDRKKDSRSQDNR